MISTSACSACCREKIAAKWNAQHKQAGPPFVVRYDTMRPCESIASRMPKCGRILYPPWLCELRTAAATKGKAPTPAPELRAQAALNQSSSSESLSSSSTDPPLWRRQGLNPLPERTPADCTRTSCGCRGMTPTASRSCRRTLRHSEEDLAAFQAIFSAARGGGVPFAASANFYTSSAAAAASWSDTPPGTWVQMSAAASSDSVPVRMVAVLSPTSPTLSCGSGAGAAVEAAVVYDVSALASSPQCRPC